NVDLALAHVVNEKLKAQGTRLDPWQFTALTHAARRAKETGESALAIPGRGSGLVAGTVRAELTRDELRRTVDAFFPEVDAAAAGPRARTTSASRLPLPPFRDSRRPCAACASRRSAWRKAAPSICPRWKSAPSWARPPPSASSHPAPAATTPPAPSSTT